MHLEELEKVAKVLGELRIELPSWGFANTGTRFGKFLQPGAATSIEEKLQDAAEVHRLTGCCPTVAVHVAWDFPLGLKGAEQVAALANDLGVRIGSINPTLFEDQDYKFGSLANPDPGIRRKAMAHIRESVQIMSRVGSTDLVVWLADGSNYPGTSNIRQRKHWLQEAFQQVSDWLAGSQRLLIEYKPFEPAFYHTDIADWGMATLLARKAGERARVLVDTGHHYHSQNIEQLVAWLLDEELLGGFHFNDRRYSDDDLTVGSIDPYQLFRIFHEICLHRWDTGSEPAVAYMVDQSHNIKGKLEAMLQTVMMVQEVLTKALLVDFEKLAECQAACRVIDSEECLKEAFNIDVRPLLQEWRRSQGLPDNPLKAYRESGYQQRIEETRRERNIAAYSSYV